MQMFSKVTQCKDRSELTLSAWIAALRVIPMSDVTEKDFLTWVEGPLRRFFPFERFLGAYVNVSGSRVYIHSSLSSGHTPELLAGFEKMLDLKSRGCFAWWVANRKPFILERAAGGCDEVGNRIFVTQKELERLEQRSIGIYAAHGVMDPFSNAGTYFSFSGLPKDRSRLIFTALDLITPVLHNLFLQTKQAEKLTIDCSTMTERQRQLMDLARQGLSDKAIAGRLAISENTVGNHFRAIYAKLGVKKRSQLVALLK